MNQGVLVFARNSEYINYGVLACWSANRVKKYLDKPVSLVTDDQTLKNLQDSSINPKAYFENVIVTEREDDIQYRRLGTEMIPFNNYGRINAYDLTPYEETLVIDTDILIQSDRLNLVWDHQEDILFSNKSQDVFGREHREFTWLKEHGIPFHWATEFYFRKSPESKNFFDYCKQVKDDYQWKSVLYGFANYPIRNDFIWSVAHHELNMNTPKIPRQLLYSIDTDSIEKLEDDSVVISAEINSSPKLINVTKQDLHIMNKYELMIQAAIELGVLL